MSAFPYSDNDNPDQILVDGDISKTLTKYATDASCEIRQEFARTLSQILRQQPLEDILNHIHDFIAAILMVSEDKTPIVRTSLVEQIPYVFLQCHEHACPDLEHYLYDRLLQIVLDYLQDDQSEVRREAYSALQLLLEKYVLDKKRIEEKVCPAILCPSHKIHYETLVEFNIYSVTLMGRIAPIIGPQKTEEFFMNHFIEMCQCKMNSVRRACAAIFPTICYVLGTNITETKLLDSFFSLCVDPYWGVRKACAESIALISLICSLNCRREQIAPIVLKLAKDSSKWVLSATFKILGQFISSFAEPCITGLAYSYNGELHITNPVDSDFRDHSDPQTVANYEHYLKMFANIDNDTPNIPTEENSSESLTNSNLSSNNNNNNNDQNDGELTSKQIASMIIDSKTKLIQQISEFPCIKRNILKRMHVWDTWGDYADDQGNNNNNSNQNDQSQQEQNNLFKEIENLVYTSSEDIVIENTPDSNNSSSSNDNVENFDSGNHSLPLSTSASSIPSSSSSSSTTIPANINNLNDTDDSSSDSINNSDNSNNDNINMIEAKNNSETNQLNINQNSNISETKGRRRTTGLLVQSHSFWRKNTPTDLSSIIKKAINDGQENKPPLPPAPPHPLAKQKLVSPSFSSSLSVVIPVSKTNTTTTNTTTTNNQLPLETPSCNPKTSKLVLDELYKEFKNILMTHDTKTNNELSDNSHSISEFDLEHASNFDTGFHSSSENIVTDKNGNEDDEEAFNEFNSYKYWHVSPELPLDTKIVETSYWKMKFHNEALITANSSIIDDDITDIVTKTTSKFKPPSSFEQNIVPSGVLESYVTMVLYEEDEEIKLNCAYNFPAVVLTVGKSNWHILKSLLQYLCDDIDWKVRKTIALSINLLAMILGKEITTRDLVPVYLGFFKDLDEVKIEAIRNFASFLKAIDKSKHEEILSNIGVCLRYDNKTNWRINEDLAKQICLLIKMYDSIRTRESLLYLTSLTGFFLEDKVSCVREIAADAMSEIIRISIPKHQEAIVKYFLVDEFANSDSWRKRQTFLNVLYKFNTVQYSRIQNCTPQNFLGDSSKMQYCADKSSTSSSDQTKPGKSEKQIVDLLHLVFPSIERLSHDFVPNIRLLVAKYLVQLININEINVDLYDNVLRIVRRLRCDDDRDVREPFDTLDLLKGEQLYEPPDQQPNSLSSSDEISNSNPNSNMNLEDNQSINKNDNENFENSKDDDIETDSDKLLPTSSSSTIITPTTTTSIDETNKKVSLPTKSQVESDETESNNTTKNHFAKTITIKLDDAVETQSNT